MLPEDRVFQRVFQRVFRRVSRACPADAKLPGANAAIGYAYDTYNVRYRYRA